MRLTILSVALLFLTSVTGCTLTGSSCGTSTGCGVSSGCSSGGCGPRVGGHGLSRGCGTKGCGSLFGWLTHSHGVCDCEYDDYCASRSPWIRTGASVVPASEAIPMPTPQKLPDGKSKKL